MQPYYEMEDEFEPKEKKEIEQKTINDKKEEHKNQAPKLVGVSLIMAKHVVKRLEKQTTDDAFSKIARQNEENNEALGDADEHYQLEVSQPIIDNIEKAPEWLIDNHYIHTGYRIGFTKVKDVLKSLFILHNETTNIWSHFAGIILFIFLITYLTLFVGK